VREIRSDIGDDPQNFFHPASYDLFVEVSGRPEVEAGWTYDPESGEFGAPEPVEPEPDRLGEIERMIADISDVLLGTLGVDVREQRRAP